MSKKLALLLTIVAVLHLTWSSNIQENSSSAESSEEIMDEKLDELKRNMTADLPPQAATFIGGILDKLKNGTSEADKIAGILQLMFVPAIIEMADNKTVIDMLQQAFIIPNTTDTNTIAV